MKVTTERLAGSRVAFDMAFEGDEVSAAMDKVYRKMVRQVNVPGFRPGKAPRYMVERLIGREAMLEEAISDVLPPALTQAMKENPDYEYIGEPESDILSSDPLTIRVIMQVMPTIELPADYRSIRVEAQDTTVDDAAVTRAIGQMQSEKTKWGFPDPERPAKLGDRAHVDIQAFTAAGPLNTRVQKDVLDLVPEQEGGNILPDLLNGILGMNVGEEKDIVTTFPEDYGREDLAAQDATFHLKLVEIQEGERPSMDEVAKEEGLADAEALRQSVRERLEQQRKATAREHQLNEILQQLAERSNVDVPEALIQQGIERRISETEERLQQQKINLTQYLRYLNKSRSEFEEEMRPEIERDTKISLIVQELAQREGLTVSDAAVRAEAEALVDTAIRQQLAAQVAEPVSSPTDTDVPDAVDEETASETEVILESEAEARVGEESAEAEASGDMQQQAYDLIRQQLAPTLEDDDFLDSIRSRLLNRVIEDRLLAIANGEDLPELPAHEDSDSSKAGPASDGNSSKATASDEETALTPDELAEQQQTEGAGELDSAQEAPAISSGDEPDPTNAPTSGQTDRANKIENDL